MYNLLMGGAAGDGIETMAGLFEKVLVQKGYYLFSIRDFMSRVRGGHNFAQIRFGPEPVWAHRDMLDGLVVFNEESFHLHKHQLKDDAFLLCDAAISIEDRRAIRFDMRTLAKDAGNPKAIGTVCIGALLHLFALGLSGVEEVLRASLTPKILNANLAALQKGYDAVTEHLPVQTGHKKTSTLLTGAEAMSLGAIAGGMRFYSAYPMSPSTTLLGFFSTHSEKFGLAVEQAEDEIAAINMALGAAFAGVRAMTGTSGGGFSLMVEGLGFAGIAEIPVVIADIQRPGPATGLPTRTEQSDLNFVISASQGEFPRMVIAVRDHADAFYQTARAFHLAQQYQIPVVLLSDQYLADSAATIPPLDMPAALNDAVFTPATPPTANSEEEYLRYQITQSGVSPLCIPGKSPALVRCDSDEHDERGVITESADVRVAMVDKRRRKEAGLASELIEPTYLGPESPEILLLGFGTTLPALREAIAEWNAQHTIPVGALCFGDVFPLPQKELFRYAAGAKTLINVEQNATGQFAKLLRQEAMIQCKASILKYDGRQMSVDDILRGIETVLEGGQPHGQ